ncbi:MAG: hypothetical protein DMG40_19110 [Acidobacteria bacterium]|nr:MAG: hypothetical protein DMG40_19110 [Acidobacteriota bacterium]
MKRAFYKGLLWLHPAGFRERFAGEMLWIFDETAEQAGPRAFADAFVSLLRQWTMHSGVWRIAFGVVVSGLLLAGYWHLVSSKHDSCRGYCKHAQTAIWPNGSVRALAVLGIDPASTEGLL